jgi:hypothetical protein
MLFCVLGRPWTEQGFAEWVNGLYFANVLWGIGAQGPGSLGSPFWEKSQNWRLFSWCIVLQTESAGSPRANTDVMMSGQKECRDQKAMGHTRYAVWLIGGQQEGGWTGGNSRKPTQQTQVWRSSTRPSGNFRLQWGTGILEEQVYSKWKHVLLSRRWPL